MRIERVRPQPPPTQFSMTFSMNDGWAVIAALKEYAERHPQAAEREQWKAWAAELDKTMRETAR